MSSVTRLHLLSQSMLNVSCQRQKHCIFPLTLTDNSMEPRLSQACNLLSVPGLSCLDVDEDEDEVVIGIRPKSSPLPRRKSSVSDEDFEPEPPLCGSRRVSFADAKGLSLVQVKEFDTWDVPKLPDYDALDGEGRDEEEYFLSSFTFFRPLSSEELFAKVMDQKAELETIELLPGTTIVKGVIRVLNISYSKAVYIRTTLDEWSTHFDLLAEYVPGSSDGVMDCFSFKLTLVPPFVEQGVRVDFCLRYETPVGTFWSNNNNRNYVLFCHHRMKGDKEKPLMENVNKKSCLKTINQKVSPVENKSSNQESSPENISTDESNNEVEVHKMNAEGPSRTLEEKKQELLMENKQNSSRRRRRKAARLARVRDYFAQRNGGANDSDRDDSHPEIKQETQEGTPGGKRADPQSYSAGSSESEYTQFVSDALETSSENSHNVAHDHTSSKSMEKSDPSELVQVENATDNPLQSADEPAPAKHLNISELVRKSEGVHLGQDVSYMCVCNTGAVSCENLVSQAGNFTFGKVVAPLYHQVFSRAGKERQDEGGEENPAQTGVFNISFEKGNTGNTVPTKFNINSGKVLNNLIDYRDSKHPEITQNKADTTQSPTATEQVVVQNFANKSKVPSPPFGDTSECPNVVNRLCDTDLLTSQIRDNLTQDLHRQIAEPQQCQPPEQTYAETVAHVDETPEQNETLTVFKPVQSVLKHLFEETDHRANSTVENNFEHAEVSCDSGLPETTIKPSLVSWENNLLESLDDFNSNHIDDTFSGASVCSLDSCEPKRKDLITLEASLENEKETNSKEKGNEGTFVSNKNKTENESIYQVDELVKIHMMINDHSQSDMFLQLKVQDTSEKIEPYDMEAAVPKREEDLYFTDITAPKNWEMMVEEEENAMLVNEERGALVNAKEALEKDASEKEREEFEEEMIAAVMQEKNTVAVEENEWIREEDIVVVDAVKGAESDSVKVIETDKIRGAEKTAEEEKKEEPELLKEKHFADILRLVTERAKVLHEDEVEVEKNMQINYKGEASVEQKHDGELKEEKKEEPILDHQEENTVIEKGEAEIVEADLCMEMESKGNRVQDFKERSDITESKVADGLSALVSNVLEVEDENTKEEQRENINTGLPNRSKTDKHPALEGDMNVSTNEPESDQTYQDSASAESDSDDEVELYMHCLRAIGASAQAHEDRIKGTAFTVSKRPSISRGKLLLTPMPSISESLDEEQLVSSTKESLDDINMAASAAPSMLSGQERSSTFSCSNISSTLLYTILLVIFLVVAYYYDFLACFGLYLISIIWLCRQGDKQPVKNNKRTG